MLKWFKKRIPVAGEIWTIKNKSPWSSKKYTVKILDVKNGWVRYYISPINPDERLELSTFLSIYGATEDA